MKKDNTEKQGKDLKPLIIESAREVFRQYGLKKTTMNDIANKINKAKGALYYYFSSKEEIYEAVIEDEADIFRNELINAVNKQTTPAAKLKSYVLTRIGLFQHLANFYTAFQKEYYEHYAFLMRFRERYDKEEIDMITAILDYGIEKGIFEIEDASLAASGILLAIKGFEYQWTLEADVKKTEKKIDFFLQIILNGINKR
ncbi:MAG: TetR/AcrR family transcriptional regulator [Bacteroidales bacterium]